MKKETLDEALILDYKIRMLNAWVQRDNAFGYIHLSAQYAGELDLDDVISSEGKKAIFDILKDEHEKATQEFEDLQDSEEK